MRFIPLVQFVDQGYVVLPKLVGNKMVIIFGNTYQLFAIGKYTNVLDKDNIDPEHFCLLITDNYKCIVNCKPHILIDYKVKRIVDEYCPAINSMYLDRGLVI